MAGLLMLGLAAAAGAATPLAPSGKWVLDYAKSACVLQRDFGEGAAKVGFGVRPTPLGGGYELLVVTPSSGDDRGAAGAGQVWLSNQGRPFAARYVSERKVIDGHRLTTLLLEPESIAPFGGVSWLRIEAGPYAKAALAPDGMAAALKALDACQADLIKSFGIDAAALAAVDKPAEPVGDKTAWVTQADYPLEAARAGEEGLSSIIWTVGADGRVGECRVVESAGYAPLDEAACAAVRERGRYRPARAKDGTPVASWDSRRVRWHIPYR